MSDGGHCVRPAVYIQERKPRLLQSGLSPIKQVARAAFELFTKALQRINRDILPALLYSVYRRLIDADLTGERCLGHFTASRSNIFSQGFSKIDHIIEYGADIYAHVHKMHMCINDLRIVTNNEDDRLEEQRPQATLAAIRRLPDQASHPRCI